MPLSSTHVCVVVCMCLGVVLTSKQSLVAVFWKQCIIPVARGTYVAPCVYYETRDIRALRFFTFLGLGTYTCHPAHTCVHMCGRMYVCTYVSGHVRAWVCMCVHVSGCVDLASNARSVL